VIIISLETGYNYFLPHPP